MLDLETDTEESFLRRIGDLGRCPHPRAHLNTPKAAECKSRTLLWDFSLAARASSAPVQGEPGRREFTGPHLKLVSHSPLTHEDSRIW